MVSRYAIRFCKKLNAIEQSCQFERADFSTAARFKVSQCLCLARPKDLSDVLREDTMLTNINVQEVLHQQTIGDLAARCSFGCSCAKAAEDVFNDADTGEMQQLAVSKATHTLSYVSYLLKTLFEFGAAGSLIATTDSASAKLGCLFSNCAGSGTVGPMQPATFFIASARSTMLKCIYPPEPYVACSMGGISKNNCPLTSSKTRQAFGCQAGLVNFVKMACQKAGHAPSFTKLEPAKAGLS